MSGLGAMMAGGNPDDERGRQVNDFYATPPEVTQALVRTMGPWLRSGKVWEPCAGDGAMLDVLMPASASIVGSDINPQRSDIGERDFLAQTEMLNDADTIITNPPFNIAERVICHGFEIGAKRMALVLKSTYWHAKGRQKLFATHRPSIIMPLTWRPDFMGLGRPTMEISWCIWNTPHNSGHPVYIPLGKGA